MKIYTRRGDTGETGILGSERIPKDDVRLEVCGNVDELNAAIGCALAGPVAPEVAVVLNRIQNELFALGARIASADQTVDPKIPELTLEHVGRLEVDIDRLSQDLPDLTEFIVPGGDNLAAHLHIARAICRRAERTVVTLARSIDVPPACLGYLNRLSDLLFVMARYQNRHVGRNDTTWVK